LLRVPGLPARLTGVAFSPDGQRLAVASLDGSVTLCDAHTGEKLGTLRGRPGPVYAVAFHPDRARHALASAHHDGTVQVRDFTTGRQLWSIQAHTDCVLGVAYSPDGRLLASAGGRDPARDIGIWEAATGKLIHSLHSGKGSFIRCVAFSPDGRRLASSPGAAFEMLVWDVATGRELHRIPSGDRVSRVAFSPDGRWLATAGEGQAVRLWDAATLQERGQGLRVSGGELWSVAFSPDGRYLASCSGYKGQGTIQIWHAGQWDK
jgi:WD40 repeat protein